MMKIFQTFFAMLFALLVLVVNNNNSVANAQDCDAICQQRVTEATAALAADKERADNWGWEQKHALDDTWEKLRAQEGETERMRGIAQEQERLANDLRGQLDAVRGELEHLKQTTAHEIDIHRTKAEEASRELGSVQFALDEANDHIKEMESSRISVNLKGIGDDIKQYWNKIIAFWTGLVVKNKDEDL